MYAIGPGFAHISFIRIGDVLSPFQSHISNSVLLLFQFLFQSSVVSFWFLLFLSKMPPVHLGPPTMEATPLPQVRMESPPPYQEKEFLIPPFHLERGKRRSPGFGPATRLLSQFLQSLPGQCQTLGLVLVTASAETTLLPSYRIRVFLYFCSFSKTL